ncbi:MAG TPA: MMPL family transporter [Pirellulales bacterium]|jgi:RND superfamily putative drug exporter|nr:MMPL family transporter [Pirellulales bacterium]
MFVRVGQWITQHWPWVIGAWLLLAVALHLVAPRWNQVTHDGDLAYLPERMPSIQGENLLRAAFPKQRSKSVLAIVVERPVGPLEPDDLALVDRLADQCESLASTLPIVNVYTRQSEIVGDKLTSRTGPDGQATIILLQLANEFMAVDNIRVLDRVLALIKAEEQEKNFPAGLRLGVTGSAALGGDMLRSAAESIKNTEWTTVGLVVLILLVVYRAPLLALIPLLSIGVSVIVATDLLALLTQVNRLDGFSWWHFKIFSTTKIFIVVILFGAGTDFCLFLISRYREELERGRTSAVALADAVGWVGHALVGSAMTTICGLGMMYFADFGKYRNSGPAIAVSLVVALLACLTLAPALVRAGGDKTFWPGGVRSGPARRSDLDGADTLDGSAAQTAGSAAPSRWVGFWDWASRVIIAYPGWILLASILVMLPPAYEGTSVPVTYDLLNELQAERPSVVGTKMALRHFAAGEMTPLTILAVEEDGHFDQSEGQKHIAQLTKTLYDVAGVASVRSITEPLGDPPGYFQPFSAEGWRKMAARKHELTRATYLTQVPELVGKVARFEIVLKYEPFSPQAVKVLNKLDRLLTQLSGERGSAWYGARFEYVGATVGVRDLQRVTESDQRLIQRLTVLVVLGVLIVILRRPVVCLYLIVSVLLSYYVTIGTTEWVFRHLYAGSFEGLDWKVPIFLFVILIAVGEDYNIYLVTRVNEEQRRHGPMVGLRVAIASTGGIITSCGAIMAGTFVSMLSGTLRGMLELGFALSLGVILDTCIVRTILVPAFLAVLDRQRASHSAAKEGPLQSPPSDRPWMAAHR